MLKKKRKKLVYGGKNKMRQTLVFCMLALLSFLFSGCDSLYLKVKGPIPSCTKINEGWISASVRKLESVIMDSYSLADGEKTSGNIKGFYSGITSAAFMPDRVSFTFDRKKYYLCRDASLFSTDRKLFIIGENGRMVREWKTPRGITDACVFDLESKEGRFLVVFAYLVPTSHNCKLWILDKEFNVVYDETLSDVWHPEVIQIMRDVFAVRTGCNRYSIYRKKGGS